VNGAIERYYASLKAIAEIAERESTGPAGVADLGRPGWPMLDSVNVEIGLEAQRQNFDANRQAFHHSSRARMSVYSISSADSGVGASAYGGYLKGVKSAAKSNQVTWL